MLQQQDLDFWIFLSCVIAAVFSAMTLYRLLQAFKRTSFMLSISSEFHWKPEDLYRLKQAISHLTAEEIEGELNRFLENHDAQTAWIANSAMRQLWDDAKSLSIKKLIIFITLQVYIMLGITLLGWRNIAVALLIWLTVVSIYLSTLAPFAIRQLKRPR